MCSSAVNDDKALLCNCHVQSDVSMSCDKFQHIITIKQHLEALIHVIECALATLPFPRARRVIPAMLGDNFSFSARNISGGTKKLST